MTIAKKIKQIKRDIDFWFFNKNFNKNFYFYTTDNDDELEELYKLRYHVYCEEYKYIDISNTVNGLEMDQWDPHSVHFVIRDLNKEISATVRLVKNSKNKFPIEHHFKFDIDLSYLDKNATVEISRLIVTRQYRRQHLLFLLIKGIYLYVKENEINNIFFVIDDRLYTLLIKMGVPVRRIGKPTMYQGFTYPCLLTIEDFERDIKINNKRLYHYLTEGVITYDQSNNKYTLSG